MKSFATNDFSGKRIEPSATATSSLIASSSLLKSAKKKADFHGPIVLTRISAPKLIRLFVEKGANPNKSSLSGKSPLSFAKNENLRKLLRTLGAR